MDTMMRRFCIEVPVNCTSCGKTVQQFVVTAPCVTREQYHRVVQDVLAAHRQVHDCIEPRAVESPRMSVPTHYEQFVSHGEEER